ncbi:MAG: hypothetical protein NXI31_09505 [bacterium]|nr:hypothetical protein [bacterium]
MTEPDAEPSSPRPARTAMRQFVGFATIAYVGLGLWLALAASPRVPYADPYRFLATYIELPFPENVLAPDNGHREVLTNLVRAAELYWLDANQWLQIGLGVALAIVAFGLGRRALHCEPQHSESRRPPANTSAALLLLAIGMFWLGNARKLAHGNEIVPLFLILASVFGGLLALGGKTLRGTIVAAALGILATVTFGSGAASFAAFFVVLLLQRAQGRQWAAMGIGAGLAATALFGAGEEGSAAIRLAPLEQFGNLMRVLGAPFVWVFSPLLDADHAARLPAPLSAIAGVVAEPAERAFGPRLAARWPAMAFGVFGFVALVSRTVRLTLAKERPTHDQTCAIGLAWFGAGVAMLVVAARLGYFRSHPDQLTTTRYLPWTMMFWTGIALTFVLRTRCSARAASGFAVAIALTFAPSQIWAGRGAFKQQRTADITALGAAVGVLDRDFPLVETEAEDLLRAVPLLRERSAAMFAWDETRQLGQRATDPTIALREVVMRPVVNLFPGTGQEVTFLAPGVTADRLMLVDATGTICGLAARLGPTNGWLGFCRGEPAAVDLRALPSRP